MRWWPRRKVYIDNLPKTHDLRFAVIFLLGLAMVFGALYGVGYAVAGDTVPRGSTVSDVEIGTLSRGEAESTLRTELVPRLQRRLVLEAERGTFRIDPQEAGATLDVEQTVDDAMVGSDWDPRHMLEVIFGGGDVDPVVAIDGAEFEATLAPVVEALTIQPKDSRVHFESGRPRVRYGSVGETVDMERLNEAVSEALQRGDVRVRIPMKPIEPHITSDEADRFVRTVARPASRNAVRLVARGTRLTVQPAEFMAALRALDTPGGLQLGIDPQEAYRLGASVRATFPGQPTAARVVLRRDRPVVVPGRPGYRITAAAWADGVLEAASTQQGARTARVDVVKAAPAFTADDARAMRIRSRIAAYTVRFPKSVPFRQVVGAARRLDQTVLRPRGELSFLSRVGGFRQPIVSSTVATATYNTALLAGLEIEDRSWLPRLPAHLPRGREAGISPRPRHDLQLTNDTPYGVLLHTTVQPTRNGGLVRVEAWSTRFWRVDLTMSGRKNLSVAPPIRRFGARCDPRRGQPAYTVELTRLRERTGQRRIDVYSSRYAPVRAIVCGRPGGGGR